MNLRSRTSVVLAAAATVVTACTGSGSDIGPRLQHLPDASSKVVVLDDQGRGVVAATARIGASSAITGRNGRGDFLADTRGRVLLEVDGTDAAATDGDHLARITFATTITRDVASPVWLPDLPDSAAATLTLGTQAAGTDVTSVAGSKLTVPSGVSVGAGGAGATVTVRLGDLAPQHLPGDLPVPVSGALLCSEAVWVDPVDVTFAAAADLEVADDLGVGTGAVTLHHLDPATGEWEALPVAASAAGGRLSAPGGVAGGGCYVFTVVVAGATVSGRVVDADGKTVSEVMVAVDQLRTSTGNDGRFTVSGVPATLADASARQAALELFAGGSWLPLRDATAVALPGASVDLGDLTFDTVLAGNIRVQQVVRGQGDSLRPARLSAGKRGVALATLSDANGQATFEDVPAEYFGFTQGRPIDEHEVFYVQSIGFLERGRRWLDAYQFSLQRNYYLGGRRSRAQVTDWIGGGPLKGADVVNGLTAGQGKVGTTTEAGQLFVVRDFAGLATATLRSTCDCGTLVHAFSIRRPDGDHLELPLQRLLRTPVGAFDRHGIVFGGLINADGSRQHELRTTRRLTANEWWEEIVEGKPAVSSLPVDVDVATTHGAFRVGVDAVAGNLAAIEVTPTGNGRLLSKAAIVADLVPVEGAATEQDLPLVVANATFPVPGLFAGAPLLFDVAQLTCDLALRQPSGRVVDVGRDLRASMGINGNDATFTLPPLTGALAGDEWLALVRGTFADGAETLGYANLVTMPAGTVLAPPQFPTISSPADGATVAASGFHVLMALPAGAVYGTIELRSTSGTDTLLWQVVVPPETTDFEFLRLPDDVRTALVAGHTYTLTVSAWLGDGIVTRSQNPYRDVTTFWQSIGTIDRGITQVVSRTITVTTS